MIDNQLLFMHLNNYFAQINQLLTLIISLPTKQQRSKYCTSQFILQQTHYKHLLTHSKMNIQETTTQQPPTRGFRDLLNDFLNIDTIKTNFGKHKNLQRSIEIFTKTPQCWGESVKVLLDEQNPNVLTLCASILKNKLQFDFSQLTEETFEELHSSLLYIIQKEKVDGHVIQKPSHALMTHLSVCIAIIYIHKFEQIGELLPYLAKCFPNVDNKNYIYTVLQVLPEQINNNLLVVEEDKRIYVKKYLKTIQRLVLIQLNNIAPLAWTTKEIKRKILYKCFSNWIDLHVDKEMLESLPQHYLLQKAFQQLQDLDVNEECILVLKNTIRSIETPHENPQLYKFMADRIIDFFPIIKSRADQQIFMCQDHVYILSTFARASRQEFLNNPSKDYADFLDNMLYITREPEYLSIPLITFWDKFLISMTSRKQAIEYYRPQLKSLFIIFCKINAFTLFQCEQLNDKSSYTLEKTNADFARKIEIRKQVEVIYRLMAECLGHRECLELAVQKITELDQNDHYFWSLLECYLNPLEEVIDEHTELSPALDQLVLKLLEVSSPYVIVQKTFIRILSNCSILYTHNPEMSLRIFNFLVNQLDNQEMFSTVSRAFENACTNNIEFVLSNIQSFIKIIEKYRDNERILKGVMIALSKEPKKLNTYFPVVFTSYVNQLEIKSEIRQIKPVLDQIIIMLKEISNENPEPYGLVVAECFGQLWEKMKIVLVKQCTSEQEESLLQKCTKLIKYALRCLKQYFHPFMNQLYSIILDSYSKYAIGSYVYLVQVLVTIFSNTKQLFQPITILFQKICQLTFVHLSKLNDIESNFGLAQDFFGMLSRFMRFVPQIVNNCTHFQSLMQLANLGCGIQNGTLARVFYSFIEDLYMQFWNTDLIRLYNQKQHPMDRLIVDRSEEMYESRENVRQMVFKNTLDLVIKMIRHLADAPSTSVRHCIVDALLSEIKAFPGSNQQLWFKVFQTIPEKILTIAEKNRFLEMVPDLTQANVDDIEELIHLMSKRYIHESIRSPIN